MVALQGATNSHPQQSALQANHAKLIHQAKTLLQRKAYAKAIAELAQVLAQDKQHIDALYITAVCQRYLGLTKDALATLNTLKQYHPNYSRAYQEEGHNLRSIDKHSAIHAYERAVLLNPALVASWSNLAALYKDTDNPQGVEHANKQLTHWKTMPPAVLSVSSMLNEGNLAKAEEICRHFLKQNPKHTEAMRLLANIGISHKVYDDAEFLLESCLTFEPEFTQARLDYVNVLQRRQKYQKALEQALILCETAPNELRYTMALANAHQAVGEFSQAIELYSALLKRVPEDSGVLIMQGHAYKTVGKTELAVAAYKKASHCRFSYGDAYWSLANLKTYTFSEEEIDRMRKLTLSPTTPFEDRFHLNFALGKAFEDRKEFEQSFQFYAQGNALKKQQLDYKPSRVEDECQRQVKVCSPDLFTRNAFLPTTESYSARPIFIVGLPRAGSTLLEQILSSHSMVDGTMELPNIMSLAHRLAGRSGADSKTRYPDILSQLSVEQLKQFGQDYLKETQIYRKGAPYFIDKMPNNFRHIGLIKLILPNAIIIDARRAPMSCGFSVYKQLFAEGQEFSYDFDHIAQYYKSYVDIMKHWQTLFPDDIIRMQYEDVVTQFDNEVRKLLTFCDLPFEEACVQFHKTQRSVRTASSEQVRQPIFTSGMEQWQKYESHLSALSDAFKQQGLLSL